MKITFDLNDSDLEKIFGVDEKKERRNGPRFDYNSILAESKSDALYFDEVNDAVSALEYLRTIANKNNDYALYGELKEYRRHTLGYSNESIVLYSEFDYGWSKGELDWATVIYNKPLRKYQITLNEAHRINTRKESK